MNNSSSTLDNTLVKHCAIFEAATMSSEQVSSEKVFMDALIAVLESAQGVTVEDLKRDVDALDIPLRALEASQGEGITVPPKNALETLANWIGDCAINFTGTNGMGNGAIATKDLKKGDEFIRVCKSKMITEETVERTKAGQAMLGDELCRSTPSLLLVVFLSLEMAKGSESDYAPYVLLGFGTDLPKRIVSLVFYREILPSPSEFHWRKYQTVKNLPKKSYTDLFEPQLNSMCTLLRFCVAQVLLLHHGLLSDGPLLLS